MKFHQVLLLLLVSLAVLISCDEDSEEAPPVIENGDVHGTITDKETGDPIAGATVDIGGKVALTNAEGKYSVEEIPFSDELDFTVTAANYRDHKDIVSLHQSLMLLDISLVPVESPSARILELLDALARDIAALDAGKIASVQSYFSKDFIASDNDVTSAGVLVGVVPPDYDGLPDAVMTMIEKYRKLEFKFVNPDVELKGNSASVWMRFEVYAETKPKPPEPANKWEIVVDGRFDLKKLEGEWKIAYWELVSDFLKFEWEPLEF